MNVANPFLNQRRDFISENKFVLCGIGISLSPKTC